MGDWYLRGQVRDPILNQQIFEERTSSIMIAVTFVACFSLFGIINLIGGTVLTFMSHTRSEAETRAMMVIHKLANDSEVTLEYTIDPLKVIGITILLTGTFLVVIGVTLGVVAFRSVGKQRRRQERRLTSCSGQTMDSFVNRSSRHSVCSTSFTTSRSRSNEKKPLEKTVSPIMESKGEDENQSGERRSDGICNDGSSSCMKDSSPSVSSHTIQNSPKEDRDDAMLRDPENQY
ncbi:hypothetical protein AVEN_243037-1 [Araneus ventricosus]|uniref:Uncharacterized protein n=1 Tax=Araneus ventricosus TaxID=182803 RepID=A0A4Y2CU99_ARAVE|nr:hypothetical protein AVEN_243037-1 [Araneus ventricosus]